MNDPIVVTRTLVKRAWSDIEPKLVWALLSGAAMEFVTTAASAYGVKIPASIDSALPLAFALLAGYIAPSVGTTVTRTIDAPTGAKIEQETHSGNVSSTITAPTAIQAPAAPPAPPQATAVMPADRQRYSDILNGLPSAKLQYNPDGQTVGIEPTGPNDTEILR